MRQLKIDVLSALVVTDKLEFGGECGLATAIEIPLARIEIVPGVPSKSA